VNGGGTFVVENKVLPGAYVNVVSAARAVTVFGDRGTVALPLSLDWGVDGEIFEVTTEDFQKDSLKIFGYPYTDDKMKNLREVFKNAISGVFYKVTTGAKATGTTAPLTATAKYKGTRGNDIKIVVATNIDNPGYFDVTTYLGSNKIETQTVQTVQSLVANDFVAFSGTGTPVATAGLTLTGGTTVAPTGTEFQAFLAKAESYDFNTLGCPSSDTSTIDLFIAFTKRLRDEVGVKFQTIVYRKAADYEGVINLENAVTDAGADPYSLVYWLAGADAACPVNKTTMNKIYDGEYTIDTNYTQPQLTAALQAGKFIFHKVKTTVRVLKDINSFVSFAELKNSDFAENQTMRVLDQMANDEAALFNNYKLGNTPNDDSGRVSFWGDIVAYNKQMQDIRAIQNVVSENIKVTKGEAKNSVRLYNPVEPVNAMGTLYVTIVVI